MTVALEACQSNCKDNPKENGFPICEEVAGIYSLAFASFRFVANSSEPCWFGLKLFVCMFWNCLWTSSIFFWIILDSTTHECHFNNWPRLFNILAQQTLYNISCLEFDGIFNIYISDSWHQGAMYLFSEKTKVYNCTH